MSKGGAGAGGVTGRGGSTGGAGDASKGGASAGGVTGRGGSTGGAGGGGRDGGRGSGGATSSTTAASTDGGPADGAGSAGNPNGSCSTGVPARGQPVDTSTPTAKIGSGTAASCTFAQLQTAVSKGGIITFDCGPDPFTIVVTATLKPPITKDTVIDGGNKITLDGGGAVQILRWDGTDWMKNTYGLTLQHLTLVNAKTTPTQAIPTAPAPCSQGWDDGEGGAVYVRDGNLTVIDCTFTNNQAAPLGPDTGGGAIYINGSKTGLLVANSTFRSNSASNAGAVGGLFATLQIYNSLFRDNKATGHDANSDDASKCSVINNDQNEVGSGGNGGAIYQDGGSSTNVLLCGVDVESNAAGTNAFGGGVFMTSNDMTGTITVQDSTITGNTGGSWTNVNSGPSLGSAFGVNAKSSTVTNSTLQK